MSQFTREGFGLAPAAIPTRGRLDGATPVQGWHRQRAVRTCARHAVDATELAELLAMLGLSTEEGR